MGKHKFVSGGEGYSASTYCEWCGLIILQRNDSKDQIKERQKVWEAHQTCPNNTSPDKESK